MFDSGSRCQRDGNERCALRAALAAGEDSAVARVVIDKAKAGDAVAARFVLGLLCPRPRGRTITLALPAAPHAGDVMAAFDATLAALALGKITPDEALTVTRVLDWRPRALKSYLLASERSEWARAARRAAPPKPSPSEKGAVQEPGPACGPFDKRSAGQGEGSRPISAGAGDVSSDRPRPGPLAQAGAREVLHSACIRPASAAAPAVSPQSHSG
jgi:hypothetical protein